jgi:hypothetical protein
MFRCEKSGGQAPARKSPQLGSDEVRSMAAEMTGEQSREPLLQLAGRYEDLARLAERDQAYESRITESWTSRFLLRPP